MKYYTPGKFAFLDMPKSGSTFVSRAMARVGLQAKTPYTEHDTRGVAGARKNGFVVFCVLRDPVEWLGSVWRYNKTHNEGWLGLPGAASILNPLESPTFAEFVERVNCRPGILGHVYRAFSEPSDHCLDLARIAADLGDLLRSRGVQFSQAAIDDLGQVNATPSKRQLTCPTYELDRLRETQAEAFAAYREAVYRGCGSGSGRAR